MDNPSQQTKRVPRSQRCRMAHDFSNDLTVILRRCDTPDNQQKIADTVCKPHSETSHFHEVGVMDGLSR